MSSSNGSAHANLRPNPIALGPDLALSEGEVIAVRRLLEPLSIESDAEPARREIAMECIRLGALLLRKNRDYGSAVFESGMFTPYLETEAAILVRMGDKVGRLVNLLQSRNASEYEGILDTVRDLAGYCILYLVAVGSEESDD